MCLQTLWANRQCLGEGWNSTSSSVSSLVSNFGVSLEYISWSRKNVFSIIDLWLPRETAKQNKTSRYIWICVTTFFSLIILPLCSSFTFSFLHHYSFSLYRVDSNEYPPLSSFSTISVAIIIRLRPWVSPSAPCLWAFVSFFGYRVSLVLSNDFWI